MPKVTYIEYNGIAHLVVVPVGLSVMPAAMADRRSPFCDDLGRDIPKSDLYKAVATGS